MKFILKLFISLLAILFFIICAIAVWLKTDHAKITLENTLSNYLSENYGLTVRTDNISFSFPFALEVAHTHIYDSDKEITDIEDYLLYIKHLKIKLTPSFYLFRKIKIDSITSDYINYRHPIKIKNKKTVYKSDDSALHDLIAPDIVINEIDFKAIDLRKPVTGLDKELNLGIRLKLKYASKTRLISFNPNIHFSISDTRLIENFSAHFDGSYDIAGEALNIISAGLSAKTHVKNISIPIHIDGNMLLDFKKDIIDAQFTYHTDIDKLPLPETESEARTIGAVDGKIDISGNISRALIKLDGETYFPYPHENSINIPSLSYGADFLITDKNTLNGDLRLNIDGLEIKGNIEYGTGDNNKIYLKHFTTADNDFAADLDLALDLKTMIVNGDLNISDKTLTETSKYFPYVHGGAVNLKLKCFSNDNKAQGINLTAEGSEITSDYGETAKVNVKFISNDILNKQISDGNIFIESLNAGASFFKELKLSAKSNKNIIEFNSGLELHQPTHTKIEVKGNVNITDLKKIAVNIEGLMGQIEKIKIKNTDILHMEFGDKINLKIPQIKFNDGTLNLTANIEDSVISSTKANIVNIPVKILGGLVSDRFAHALINGSIILTGKVYDPVLTTDINITEILAPNTNKKFGINLTSKTDNKQTKLTADAKLGKKNLASVDAELKNIFSLSPFKYEIMQDGNFIVNSKLTNQLNILSLMPELPGQKIEGILSGNLKITGTPNLPYIKSNLKLSQGKYVYKNYGIKFKDITTDVYADGKQIIFPNIEGKDNFNNKLSGSGKIDSINKSFRFEGTTTKLIPMNTPYVQGELSGRVTVGGNLEKALAEGTFIIGPLEIKIPDRFKETIPELNVVKEIDENSDKPEQDSVKPYKFKLNIDLKTNNKVFVRGRGVDTMLDGKLKIEGNVNNPIVTGTLRSVKGRYQEFGKVLNVKEGVLTFDGPIGPSPFLNITGVTTVGNTEIRLILSGSITSPDISIESTPAMSEERALSMLLFGTNTENISTFQALQLADSARRLSGRGGGFDPLGIGRKILGVDDINFKTDADDPEKSSVGVGKYLTDKIYFEIEQGQEENTTKTRIEVQVTPKISVENIFDQGGNTSFGVNWRFDY